MKLLKVLLTVILIVEFTLAVQNITVPKNFTRSRYSLRRAAALLNTTTLPTNNDTISSTPLPTTTAKNVTTKKSIISTTTTTTTTKAPKAKITKLTGAASTIGNTTVLSTPSPTIAPATTTTTAASTLTTIEPIKVEHCGEQIGEHFPWIAVIEHTKPNGKRRRKTLSKGVLIDAQHVLTTVSSIHNSLPFWIVSAVRLGDTPTWGSETDKHNKSMVLTIGIDSIYKHQYKDIAIIRLMEKINFTDYITPVCLPEDDNYNFRELQFHICKRSSSKSITKLPINRYVSVSPLSPQDCTIMFHRKHAIFTLEEFCAWDETGDTCTGDLGGPLVGKLNGRYQVIGLNSYVNTRSEFSADDYPGVYTRVGSHLKWIKTILNDK